MKAVVAAFNQEKALVGAFSVIVQPVVEPMEHYTALIKVSTPYPMTRGEDDKHYTYLDTTGRTVVTLYTDKTLTENHIQDFQIG